MVPGQRYIERMCRDVTTHACIKNPYFVAMTERCPMEEKALESWDNEMALNLTAPFMLSKHFAGSMKKKGK